MKRVLTALLLLLLLVPLAGCALFPSRRRGVEQLLVVQALGVDARGGGVTLSAVSAADSARGEGPVRLSGAGASILGASDDILSRANEEELFCAHTGHILLGETSVPQELDSVLRYICRSREIRMDVPLWLVRGGSARDALLNSGDERVGAVELLDALGSDAVRRNGEKPPSAAQIVSRLEAGDCALIAALRAEPSAEQTADGSPLTLTAAGYGVVRDGRLLGFLEQEELIGLDFLRGAQGVHELSVTDRSGRRLTLQTAPGRTRSRLVREEDGEKEAVELEIVLSASLVEQEGEGAYSDELSALLEREVLRRAAGIVRRQKELGCDLLGFGDLPLRLSASVRLGHASDMREGV